MRINTLVKFSFFLKQVSATSYLPRRWPSKYFHLNESLRPCSGWERVFSSRLVTDEFFYSWRAHSKLHNENKLRKHQLCLLTWFLLAAYPNTSFLKNYRFLSLGSDIAPTCFVRLRSTPHYVKTARKSPRPISNTRLKMLPLLHLCPINVVFCNGTY